MKRIFLISICFLRLVSPLQAQFQKADAYMPSPNAASLGTYGTFPVSYFSGLPQVEIPIFDLREGSQTVPISLNYHGSGVKPDQFPGWTGLNWNLNAGGAISRTVKDIADEFDCPNTTVKKEPFVLLDFRGVIGLKGGQAGYFFNKSVNNQSDWNTNTRIKSLATDSKDAKDTEPDEFSFSFLGYSGKFYLSETGNWEVQSEQAIKVIFEENNFLDLPGNLKTSTTQFSEANCVKGGDNLRSFGGFTLITEDGTKYIFGGTTDAIEYSIPFHQQLTEHWVANTWYLSKIKMTNGKEINFFYEPDSFIANMYLSFLWYFNLPLKNNSTIACLLYGDQHFGFGNDGEVTADWITPRFASYLGSLIRPVYLSSIQTSAIEAKFNRASATQLNYAPEIFTKNEDLSKLIFRQTVGDIPVCGDPFNTSTFWPYLRASVVSNRLGDLLAALKWKKLSSVTIKRKDDLSNNGIFYEFDYNDSASERLMLKTIWKESLDGSLITTPYRFDYYQDVSLPSYLSESTDHWGFNNGNTTKCFTQLRTMERVQDPADYINKASLVKAPTQNLLIARSGALKKILFPTGGSSEFIYELNNYSKVVNTNRQSLTTHTSDQLSGGLRIRKIISSSSEPSTPSIEKEYFYVNGYFAGYSSESNSLLSSGILSGIPEYFFQNENTLTDDPAVKKIRKEVISSQNIQPFSVNSSGIHIGYNEVVEKLSDGSYTIFKFTNYESSDGNHYDENPLPGSYTDVSYTIPFSDRSFERGKLISEEIYRANGARVRKKSIHYEPISPITNGRVKSLMLSAMTYNCFETNFLAYSGYPYYHYTYKFKPTWEENYSYDQFDQNKYAVTKTYFSAYNSLGQIREVKEEKDEIQIVKKFRYPEDLYLSPPNTYSGNTEGFFLLQQQNISQPVEEYVYRKNSTDPDGIISASLYLYKENPLKLGQVVPDVSYVLKTDQPLTVFNFGSYILNSSEVGKDTHYQLATSSDYNEFGNISGVIDISGVRTSFLWDADNNFIIAKSINAAPEQIFHSSFEDNNGIVDQNSKTGQKLRTTSYPINISNLSNGDYILSYWSRTSNEWSLITTSVNVTNNVYATTISASESIPIDEVRFYPVGAHITTYTYDVLKGMTSINDSNNRVEYYEYDPFGRLSIIKDHNRNIVKVLDYNYQAK